MSAPGERLFIRTRTTLRMPGVQESLARRLLALQPDSPRRWGSMSAGGMLCHLGDAFCRMLALPAENEAAPPWVGRVVVRPLALRVPLRWPRNVATPPSLDQRIGGTRPGDFEQDRARVLDQMEQFAATRDFAPLRHPIFGQLTEWEWMRWAWLHTDHHLRQFSV